MRIDVITIFPEMFASPLECSILGRARAAGILEVCVHNLRDWTTDRHHVVDDYPYGGGGGMVLKPEPLFAAVEDLNHEEPRGSVVLLTPQGRTFDQAQAEELAKLPRVILVCGHYEGVDERVREALVDTELSIGDYVLTGGEPAALVVVDAVCRLLPGALGDEQAPAQDSFGSGLLEYPHYTRPAEFRGRQVPEILLSGNHGEIRRWRRKEALRRTRDRRPDLLGKATLNKEDEELLQELAQEEQEIDLLDPGKP
ncbi:MAG: tRNA (guanosine(37)-N1)-methyltransferase TrmD [candidate division WS1 bacterium]|jgi:tRNA (guanine37-N1)-methyltransferase|nr:tRNA (guanosine(37)-N1)-methyltransferase TrmD [candidate division WS1 bacterium]